MTFRGKFPQEIEDMIFDYVGPYTKYLNGKLCVDKNKLSINQIKEILHDIFVNDMIECLTPYINKFNKHRMRRMTCFLLIPGDVLLHPNIHRYTNIKRMENYKLHNMFTNHFSNIIFEKHIKYFTIKNIKNVLIYVNPVVVSVLEKEAVWYRTRDGFMIGGF